MNSARLNEGLSFRAGLATTRGSSYHRPSGHVDPQSARLVCAGRRHDDGKLKGADSKAPVDDPAKPPTLEIFFFGFHHVNEAVRLPGREEDVVTRHLVSYSVGIKDG